MAWSASQYTKFERERNRPILDLLAQIATTPVRNAIDLGCGPGNSTELLMRRFPEATVTGIDNSDDMIAAARNRLPGVRFDLADIAAWSDPGPFDVIFANAALQWLPDHALLLPELMARLAPGGSLAVQMPDNLDEPAHRLMRDVAAQGPWADKLAAVASSRAPRHDEAWYYAVLCGVATRLDIWRTTYLHALPGGAAAVVEWFKGSGLRPFLEPLDEFERATFLVRYEDAVAKAYPVVDGAVLLPFPRLFFVAQR